MSNKDMDTLTTISATIWNNNISIPKSFYKIKKKNNLLKVYIKKDESQYRWGNSPNPQIADI